LLAGLGLAAFDDLITLAMGTGWTWPHHCVHIWKRV
jgi:hypothetical protein